MTEEDFIEAINGTKARSDGGVLRYTEEASLHLKQIMKLSLGDLTERDVNASLLGVEAVWKLLEAHKEKNTIDFPLIIAFVTAALLEIKKGLK